MKKIYASIITALMLCFGLGARADNVVGIGSAEGAPGSEVTVAVSLANTDAVSSMQLQIPMPGNMTLVEGSAVVSSRASGHQASAGIKDSILNIFVYSMEMAPISGSGGEVMTLRFLLGNTPKSMTLNPTSVLLNDKDGNPLSGTATAGTVTVRAPKGEYGERHIDFGHIPIRETYHRTIPVNNTGNAPLVVTGLEFPQADVFSSSTAFPFTVEPGGRSLIDVTYAPMERGTIQTEVKVLSNSASRLNTIVIDADPFSMNELHIENASGVSDESVTIHLRVNNMDALTGFQIEFDLPEQLKYVEGSAVLSGRKADHSLVATHKGGHLTLIAYSASGKTFTDEDGEIASFDVELKGQNGTNLNATSSILTATYKGKDIDVCSATYGGYVTIQSPRFSADSEINLGTTPITKSAEYAFRVRNFGSALLVINRVVFDDNAFSVKETLPLTIEAGSDNTMNICFDSKEEKAFEHLMQIYSNDPDQRLWNVRITGSRLAPNYLNVQTDDVFDSDNLKVRFMLDTYDNMNGLQFDMEYPSDYYEPLDEVLKTERSQSLTVTRREINENVIRFFCYSLNDAAITAGEGDLFTLQFKPKGNIPQGQYNLRLSNVQLGTGEMADKYAGAEINSSFKVLSLSEPLTITAKNLSREYGETNPALEYTHAGATLYGEPEIACEATTSSSVGEYPIVVNQGTVKNRNVTYVNGVLNVTKAPLSITARSYSIKQGETLPTFEVVYSVFKNGETKDVLTKQPVVSCEATAASAPGKYDIIVSGAEAQNYDISYVLGTLTITDADPVKITAKSYTREYGEVNPAFEYTVEGAELEGTPEFICEATSTSPVGEYPIIIKKGSVANYNDTYINGVLTITKAPLSIKAGNYTKKQGQAMPEFELTYEGFKNNETKDVLIKQPIVSCEANVDSEPGEYNIVASSAEALNYEIQYVVGQLIVTEPDSYTLTYKVDGEVYQSFSIKYRDTITVIVPPIKEGYTFSGWSEIPATMPLHDVMITGSFSKGQYSLTYLVDGRTYKVIRMDYDNQIIPESEPTREGYTFYGWSEIPATMPAHDVLVTGYFAINSYTLTYKVDGEEYKTATVAYGTALTAEAVPTKEGYTFNGWSEIPETMPAHDVVINGTFAVNSYTLTYKVDGEVYKTVSIDYGTVLIPETSPNKEGYTFSGWSEIPATMPANDVVITGTFAVNSYTLTYQVDGEEYKTSTVVYGTNLTSEATPSKEGYSFSGWSEIPATMPAHDVMITGSFTVNMYKIRYYVGEQLWAEDEVEYGARLTLRDYTPADDNRYSFAGWDGEQFETMPAKDIEYRAMIVDGISRLNADTKGIEAIYDGAGRKLSKMQRGVNVLRMKDGTTRKVFR